jgi:hypothetical protein
MATDEIKTFQAWLILDYKTSKFRVMKKIGKLKPTEIAIDVSLNVTVPKSVTLKAHGTIELSTAKVNEMVLEELEA